MSKALREYKKFLNKQENNFSIYEKKLAKIILDNFENIENKNSYMGSRGKLIGSLVTSYGEFVEEPIFSDETPEIKADNQFKSLSSLTVKNFRGFSNEQVFDLEKPYTFVYGPNGSGKTSFCEALEYGLLGSINDANTKRISLDAYIKNADTGQAQKPIIEGINSENNKFFVQSMPIDNEFCFIERNRIDGFARVSANTPMAQQQRLASLFGLEEFNTFVMNFNENLDNYLDCEGKLKKVLSEKEKEVDSHNQILRDIPDKEDKIVQREKDLLAEYSNIDNLKDVKEKVEELIQKNIFFIEKLKNLKSISYPNIEEIILSFNNVNLLINERVKKKESLLVYKKELSLKDLYIAILKNEDKFPDTCPACESKIFKADKLSVPLNPYHNALAKVKEFDAAIQIENRLEEISEQIPTQLMIPKSNIPKMLKIAELIDFPKINIIEDLSYNLLKTDDEKQLCALISVVEDYFIVLRDFNDHLIKHNQKVSEAKNKIVELKIKNISFTETLHKISRILSDTESINENKKHANGFLHNFKEENSELIIKVEKEKKIVARNCQYRDAYASFKSRLVEYNRQLPSLLVSSLSDKATEFYNSINKFDYQYDLLEEIKLPSGSGEKIEIRFKNGSNLDALYILSEGHIRCLGLSILLAKIVEDNLPIVIFDDVVNAIDDEHRRGVIETIFENEHIKIKQLIITTHGEEFVKQLEDQIPHKEHKEKVNRIDFLKTDENKKIVVKLDSARSYLVIAQEKLKENQLRDSLANGRRALEKLLHKLWNRIGKEYPILLNVEMRYPDRSPELMSTANSLIKYIGKHAHEYVEIQSSLEILAGRFSKNQFEWSYLNKGTHEEERKEEFDRSVVKEIIELLITIDDNLNQIKKKKIVTRY
ncbi:AAA family ATPase [Carnobacterium alterfunditum]|uniref:AAA family ATPase n=1 Tax=Carnobacterium alterfunditum TaxID=28230 RepID=UPI003593064F